MLAGSEGLDSPVEVVEGDGEAPWVAAGGLETESRCSQISGPDEGQELEADQRRLLGELVNGGVAGGEHRDAVLAVDGVVSVGVRPQRLAIEVAAADDDRVVIVETIAVSECRRLVIVALLQARLVEDGHQRRAPSGSAPADRRVHWRARALVQRAGHRPEPTDALRQARQGPPGQSRQMSPHRAADPTKPSWLISLPAWVLERSSLWRAARPSAPQPGCLSATNRRSGAPARAPPVGLLLVGARRIRRRGRGQVA